MLLLLTVDGLSLQSHSAGTSSPTSNLVKTSSQIASSSLRNLLSHDADQPARTPGLDINSCNEMYGHIYILNYGIAVQNAKDFCSQSELSKEYVIFRLRLFFFFILIVLGMAQGP
jgi:hypothetical protein